MRSVACVAQYMCQPFMIQKGGFYSSYEMQISYSGAENET